MSDGLVRVYPVLFCAPVWWTPGFWDESAHATDWVRPETPLDVRPSAVVEVSLDATLGEVLGVACGAWGLRLGPDNVRRGRTVVEDECARFGFVRSDSDVAGLTPEDGLRWPQTLPVAREDGTVERVSGRDVSFRRPLVSSDLGLITGDVTRPYVHPVRPQGDPALVGEIAHLAVEAVHAAYAAVDARIGIAEHVVRLVSSSLPTVKHSGDDLIDEGQRIVAVALAGGWLRRWWRKRRSPPA
jgi:hypothetical protein